jgi:hypothetical protein
VGPVTGEDEYEEPILTLDFLADPSVTNRQGIDSIQVYGNGEVYVGGWFDQFASWGAAVQLTEEARLRLIQVLCQTLLP